jgi:curli biogenesis system outer membrane secretion channel CsgG
MNSRRVDRPAALSLPTIVAIVVVLATPHGAAAQDANFVDKKGRQQPIETMCLNTDKCDSKWLSVQYPSYAGRKLRVVIAHKTEATTATEWSVGGVEDMLIQALLQTGRVTILEDSGGHRPDYIIGVTVNNAGSEQRGTGGLAGAAIGSGLGLGGLGVNKNRTRLAMTVRLVNAETDEVESVLTVEGTASASSLNLGGLGIGARAGGAGGTSGWKSPSLAAAAQVCANKAAYRLVQEVLPGD